VISQAAGLEGGNAGLAQIRRRFRQHLAQKPEGHGGSHDRAIIVLPDFQAIEEALYIGIGTVDSYRSFGAASKGNEQ